MWGLRWQLSEGRFQGRALHGAQVQHSREVRVMKNRMREFLTSVGLNVLKLRYASFCWTGWKARDAEEVRQPAAPVQGGAHPRDRHHAQQRHDEGAHRSGPCADQRRDGRVPGGARRARSDADGADGRQGQGGHLPPAVRRHLRRPRRAQLRVPARQHDPGRQPHAVAGRPVHGREHDGRGVRVLRAAPAGRRGARARGAAQRGYPPRLGGPHGGPGRRGHQPRLHLGLRPRRRHRRAGRVRREAGHRRVRRRHRVRQVQLLDDPYCWGRHGGDSSFAVSSSPFMSEHGTRFACTTDICRTDDKVMTPTTRSKTSGQEEGRRPAPPLLWPPQTPFPNAAFQGGAYPHPHKNATLSKERFGRGSLTRPRPVPYI